MAVAIKQCQELGAKLVCTEHLLLGLLKERGSVACKALKKLGLTHENARNAVLELTSEACGGESRALQSE